MFPPDELERPVQTWGKAEKREGEGFVPSSTVQGWGAGVLLYGNREKPVFRVDAIRWSDSRDRFFSTRSNDPAVCGVDRGRGGKRKSARERGLYRLQQCRVGARALFCTGIAKNRLSASTPFDGPTARIASPRRDLTIRRAAAWIADVGESGKARGRGICTDFHRCRVGARASFCTGIAKGEEGSPGDPRGGGLPGCERRGGLSG